MSRKKETLILSVTAFKGGVGKTIISQNLAHAFALDKFKVCIIDADTNNRGSMYWSLNRPEDVKSIPVIYEHGDGQKITHDNLTEVIDRQSGRYEVIVVDCPPVVELITSKASLASDMIIIPVNPNSGNDEQAVIDFMERVKALRQRAKGKHPVPAYILINMWRGLLINKQIRSVIEEEAARYDVSVLDTIITQRTVFGVANYNGLTVYEDENDKAKQEINTLYKEISKLLKGITYEQV